MAELVHVQSTLHVQFEWELRCEKVVVRGVYKVMYGFDHTYR